MSKQNQHLLKLLGVGFGIAVTVGGTIGTGILRKPGPIAALIGDPWMILYCGLLSVFMLYLAFYVQLNWLFRCLRLALGTYMHVELLAIISVL
jgi:hypothetical protein